MLGSGDLHVYLKIHVNIVNSLEDITNSVTFKLILLRQWSNIKVLKWQILNISRHDTELSSTFYVVFKSFLNYGDE